MRQPSRLFGHIWQKISAICWFFGGGGLYGTHSCLFGALVQGQGVQAASGADFATVLGGEERVAGKGSTGWGVVRLGGEGVRNAWK